MAGVVKAARSLLGARLISDVGGVRTSVRVTEVEAYGGVDDPASHAFGGETPRNRAMFGPAGRLYVYRSYGIHWCVNLVVGPEGVAAAVLIRGGAPLEGVAVMEARRGRTVNLTDGPGKLCQALGITGDHDGLDVHDPASPIRFEPGESPTTVVATPRIGITRAVDIPWRFVAGE